MFPSTENNTSTKLAANLIKTGMVKNHSRKLFSVVEEKKIVADFKMRNLVNTQYSKCLLCHSRIQQEKEEKLANWIGPRLDVC